MGEEKPATGRARRRGRARRALAAERCPPEAGGGGAGRALPCGPGRAGPRARPPALGVVTRSPEQGVCSPSEAAGGALGALMHRPGPAAAVRKVNKNVIMRFLVGARNEREDNPSFSREEIREIPVLDQISILSLRVLNRQTLVVGYKKQAMVVP